jgi:hypothetical protein
MSNIDWNAKPTATGYLLAAVGATIGIAVGTALRPKIEDAIRRRKIRKSLNHAMQNPTIVPNVPGSPIDIATQKYMNKD